MAIVRGDKRNRYSETKNIDHLSLSSHIGRRSKDLTEGVLEKERLTDEIINRLAYDTGLSKESEEEIRKSIDKALDKYTFQKDKSQKTTIETNMDMLEEFLSAKRVEGKSSVTLYNYGNEITKVFMNIDKLYNKITTDDIRAYMNYRKVHDGLSPTSIANIRMYLRSFFSWMKAEEKIKKNPMDRIGTVKTEKKVIETLSDEEVEIIRCACESERDLAIVDILSGSGMRVSELCRLNKEDVDLENGTMKVFGKGSKERICFLTGKAKVHLKWYLDSRKDDNPALFVTNKKPHERLTKNGVEFILRNIARTSKVPTTRLYPHKYRSTLATNMINKGAAAEHVQGILGHSSVNTTLKCYAKVDKETYKRAHKQYAGN